MKFYFHMSLSLLGSWNFRFLANSQITAFSFVSHNLLTESTYGYKWVLITLQLKIWYSIFDFMDTFTIKIAFIYKAKTRTLQLELCYSIFDLIDTFIIKAFIHGAKKT